MPLLGAGEELGELYHSYLKQWQGIRGTPQLHHEAMVDAVGDIAIYLIDFCNMRGIDFEQAIIDTWIIVGQRDWQKFPGNGVTE